MARCRVCGGTGQIYESSYLMDIPRPCGACHNGQVPDPPIDVTIQRVEARDPNAWIADMAEMIRDGKHNQKRSEDVKKTAADLAKARRKLIHEWDILVGKATERFRLIAVADATPGYEDRYLIEKLTTDGLGEPRWDHVDMWGTRGAGSDSATSTINLLVAAVKSLLKDPT